jgi:hypothetical protein
MEYAGLGASFYRGRIIDKKYIGVCCGSHRNGAFFYAGADEYLAERVAGLQIRYYLASAEGIVFGNMYLTGQYDAYIRDFIAGAYYIGPAGKRCYLCVKAGKH